MTASIEKFDEASCANTEERTRHTVEVHRPDADPQLFNVQQTLTADPALPGFSTPVRTIFE